MFRITRIAPTAVLTAAALALAAPAAQAKPFIAPSGGVNDVSVVAQSGGPNDVSPIVRSIQAANAAKHAGAVVVTTGDKPLANPVQLPAIKTSTASVSTPDSGNGFDWTAAGIGAGLGGIVMLTLAAGVGFRRRGQLAA
jgi:hypothetical protein